MIVFHSILILKMKIYFSFRKCGCGEGDSGCNACGICRRCADSFAGPNRTERTATITTDLDDDASVKSDTRSGKLDTFMTNNLSEVLA